MIRKIEKKEIRKTIHERIRRKLRGSAARPRLAVFRSVAHIYAQVIDDAEGKTLVSASSVDKGGKGDPLGPAATWRRPRRSANWWPSGPRKRALPKWFSTAAAINTTGG